MAVAVEDGVGPGLASGRSGPRQGSRGRVVVVGAGVIGTMHALLAVGAGLEVVHIEREIEPRGASTRNFGLVWVSGRASGADLELALRGRRLWEEVALSVEGLHLRTSGSLTLAATQEELEVMREACSAAGTSLRRWELLSVGAAVDLCPEVSPELAGALYCPVDAVVEPRQAVHVLREHLRRQPRYTWVPAREVVGLGPGAVCDDLGQWHRGDHVYLCTGATTPGLLSRYVERPRTRRVRLQMLETTPYRGEVGPALANGDSLRYYPAYDVPALADLPPQPSSARAAGAQLLLVQRVDGGLTIGDTHEYDEPFPFDLEEDLYDHLLGRAASLLRQPLPPVRRRWAGVYAETLDKRAELYWREEVLAGVEVVNGPGGRGMTCAPAIAEVSIARLLDEAPSAGPAGVRGSAQDVRSAVEGTVGPDRAARTGAAVPWPGATGRP